MIRTSATPASFRRAPFIRPARPPPMNTTVRWSVFGGRSVRGVYGSSRPVSLTYWVRPSGRSRLARSAWYLRSRACLSMTVPSVLSAVMRLGAPVIGTVSAGRRCQVDGRVPVEEPAGLEREPRVLAGHHREVLRLAEMRGAHRVPQHDIRIGDGPVGGGPGGQPRATGVLVGEVTGRAPLIRPGRRHPQVLGGERRTGRDGRALLGQQRRAGLRDELVPDRLTAGIQRSVVDDLPVPR